MPWQTDTPMRACPHWSPESPVSHPKTTVRAGLIPVTLGPSLLKSLSVGNFRETRQKGFFFSSRGSNAPHLLSLHTSGHNCASNHLCSSRTLFPQISYWSLWLLSRHYSFQVEGWHNATRKPVWVGDNAQNSLVYVCVHAHRSTHRHMYEHVCMKVRGQYWVSSPMSRHLTKNSCYKRV